MNLENLSFDLKEGTSLLKKIVNGPDFYTVKDLADFFNVNYMTMFRRVKGTDLLGFQFGKKGSQWRIPKEAVLEFINNSCCTNKGSEF